MTTQSETILEGTVVVVVNRDAVVLFDEIVHVHDDDDDDELLQHRNKNGEVENSTNHHVRLTQESMSEEVHENDNDTNDLDGFDDIHNKVDAAAEDSDVNTDVVVHEKELDAIEDIEDDYLDIQQQIIEAEADQFAIDGDTGAETEFFEIKTIHATTGTQERTRNRNSNPRDDDESEREQHEIPAAAAAVAFENEHGTMDSDNTNNNDPPPADRFLGGVILGVRGTDNIDHSPVVVGISQQPPQQQPQNTNMITPGITTHPTKTTARDAIVYSSFALGALGMAAVTVLVLVPWLRKLVRVRHNHHRHGERAQQQQQQQQQLSRDVVYERLATFGHHAGCVAQKLSKEGYERLATLGHHIECRSRESWLCKTVRRRRHAQKVSREVYESLASFDHHIESSSWENVNNYNMLNLAKAITGGWHGVYKKRSPQKRRVTVVNVVDTSNSTDSETTLESGHSDDNNNNNATKDSGSCDDASRSMDSREGSYDNGDGDDDDDNPFHHEHEHEHENSLRVGVREIYLQIMNINMSRNWNSNSNSNYSSDNDKYEFGDDIDDLNIDSGGDMDSDDEDVFAPVRTRDFPTFNSSSCRHHHGAKELI